AAVEERRHLDEQPLILSAPRTLAATPPCVVARARHAVERAHSRDGERVSLGVDELEDLRLRAEENRMAFFKSSCSAFKMACARLSACSRLISRVRWGLTSTCLAFPLSRPSRASVRQRDNMMGWMSRASATV